MEQPINNEISQEQGIWDVVEEGPRYMGALLRAIDKRQADMSEDEIQSVNEKLLSGELPLEELNISAWEILCNKAVIYFETEENMTREDAEKKVKQLYDAGESIPALRSTIVMQGNKPMAE